MTEHRLLQDVPKAAGHNFLGRFREIVSDPLNLLIERVPEAGYVFEGKVVLHNGHRVPVSGPGSYYGEFSRILAINRGVHEPLEEYVFQQLLKHLPAAPLMVELGAYWAHYSMWMKLRRPNSTTIMVEPALESLEAGRANFALNGYTGEFIQAFVGKRQWELDRFLAARGIRHLDVLHVDIQGFELELLQSGRAALSEACVDYLFVSTHSADLHESVRARLDRYGYRIEAAADFDSETTSNDGFVFAVSPKVQPVFRDFVAPSRVTIANSSAAQLLEQLAAARAAAL